MEQVQTLTPEEKIDRLRKQNAYTFLQKRGKRYLPCRFTNFEITNPEQQKAFDKLREFEANAKAETDQGNGVVLFGPSGTGKDHLITALALSFICRHGGVRERNSYSLFDDDDDDQFKDEYSVEWKSGAELFAQLRDAIGSDYPESDIIHPLIDADILILSDPLPPGGELTRYQREILYRVLDARYSAMQPTWASLNVASGGEAGERMGVPCYDRLRHGALCLYCNWPSYRSAK